VVEGKDVRIVDDRSGDEPERWNPSRSRRIAVTTAVTLVVAVLVFVETLSSTDQPPGTLPEALPATTTTSSTTTVPPTTTSTIAVQTIRYVGNAIQVGVETFCQDAIAARPDGFPTPLDWLETNLPGTEEWFETNFPEMPVEEWLDFRTGYPLVLRIVDTEANKARNAQDAPLLDALVWVVEDVEDVQDAFGNAFDALLREDPDEWSHQFDLIERLCERLNLGVESMVSYEG